MYVALVQFSPKTGALRDNAERALACIKELAESVYPPDLVVFPALALTGANVGGLVSHSAFAVECLDVVSEFIARAQLPTLFGAMIPRLLEDGESFICESEVILCQNGEGGALGFVDIKNEWPADQCVSRVEIKMGGHRLSIILDDYPEKDEDFSHSDVVIMMLAKEYEGTNSLFTSSTQINYLRGLAKRNRSWILAANLVGAEDDRIYDGGSILLDSSGCIRDSAEPFVEQTLMVNLDLHIKKPASPKDQKTVKPLLPCEADWKALKLSLSDYVRKNGFTDVVLGLSGGIDSACVAALAVDALGPKHVHAILMPGPFSSPASMDDAITQAALLGIDYKTFSITELYNTFLRMGNQVLDEISPHAIALENLQARLRMLILMYFSNTYGWLLLNTSNKSEIAVGYSTLYGDSAGMFAPLGNLYKTDVYELIAWRNEQNTVIPQSIVDKEPSAELREGQRDTDTLPPYETLDRILRLHIEDDFGIDQIIETARQESGEPPLEPELISSVLGMVKKAEFKRRQMALAPTLGATDLSAERAWPITCGFSDHNRNLVTRAKLLDYLKTIYPDTDFSDFNIFKN